jgi:cellulose synthase/poly-beta-1,6-N-acetylglucosamine synthase-like glycosyltransferase
MAEAFFFVSLFAIVYPYLIYPICLAMLVRLVGREVKRYEIFPYLSILCIVFNEEDNVERKIESIRRVEYPEDRIEVVFVSDGSTDMTDSILMNMKDIRFIRFEGRNGKAHIINRVMDSLQGELVVFTDVRQEFSPDALKEIVKSFADPEVGCVSGELVFRDPESGFGEGVSLYWRYEKLIRRLESELDSVVGATGAFYAIRKENFRRINDDSILDDVEIPMAISREGKRVLFDSKAVIFDNVKEEPAGEFVRKARTMAGNFQLLANNPWLLSPSKNRLFWQYVSHKLLRLTAPLFMIILLVSNIFLLGKRIFFDLVLLFQAVFYIVGSTGFFVRYRLPGICSSFILMNLAVVSGFWKFVRGDIHTAWKRK